MNYVIGALVILLLIMAAALVYLYMLVESLRKTDMVDLQDDLEELSEDLSRTRNQTPRVFINEKNEAVVTLQDGKTEIYNYDLKRKK